MAAPPASATRAPGTDGAPQAPCLGVLFVHGAGDHGTGSTLIEFGEPLVAWLSGWLRHGEPGTDTDRAIPGVTQILVREGDTHAPAHSYVRLFPELPAVGHLAAGGIPLDEAFTPPGFQQVLLWAIGVVPWTVLTQFIGPLQRRAKLVPATPIGVGGYLWRVVVAAATALIVSAVVFALAFLILILSLIPIDAVRGIVGSLQASPRPRSATCTWCWSARCSERLHGRRPARHRLVARAGLRPHRDDRSLPGRLTSRPGADRPGHRSVDLYLTFGSGLYRPRSPNGHGGHPP